MTTRTPLTQFSAGHRPPAWHTLRYGLAALWLLDGLLQLQPGMFTMDMVSNIMQPAATGEPVWLYNLITWSIQMVTPHLVAFNWAVVVIQLAIGLMLLVPRPKVVAGGLWLSIVWSAMVWLFGEGLGQLLTGSASFLTGAPGSVFFYAVAGGLLLWPDGWARERPLPAGRRAIQVVALSLLLAAALQLVPAFWTGLGLGTSIASAAMMPQPEWLRWTIDLAAMEATRAPLVMNLGIIVISFGLGMALLATGHHRWLLAATIGWLAVVWWFGQGMGALFSGMATDPNTAPVLALLLWAGWRTEPAGNLRSARWGGARLD